MTEEIWKPVPGIEKYEASSLGRIKSPYWGILKGHVIKKNGRPSQVTVYLTRNGIRKTYSVHRLVLETFIGPCPHGMEGCHNDGDGTNNKLDNLRWDTHKSNMQDAIRHGTFYKPRGFIKGHSIRQVGEANNLALLKEVEVRMIKLLLKEGFTMQSIADGFKVGIDAISRIKYKKTWKHLEDSYVN